MKILLISTNRNKLPMPVMPIGACIVAHAAERAGHTVFFLDGLQIIVQTIRSRTGTPIILGGAALGIMPEQILRLVPDCIAVIGDGELVFPQLLDRIFRKERFGDLPGIAWIEKGNFRLNSFLSAGFSTICPAPDYHRWLNIPYYRSRMATVPIQTKTGCQYNSSNANYAKTYVTPSAGSLQVFLSRQAWAERPAPYATITHHSPAAMPIR